MNPSNKSQEASSKVRRISAITAMRDRANRLRRRAARWEELANALDKIEKYAISQSKDGSEGSPHIGAGSASEEFLWELASKSFESGL
jgi:hypothetical protein